MSCMHQMVVEFFTMLSQTFFVSPFKKLLVEKKNQGMVIV